MKREDYLKKTDTKYKFDKEDDYVSMILDEDNHKKFVNYNTHESRAESKKINITIVCAIIIAIVVAIVIIKMPAPKGKETTFDYYTQIINDDKELIEAFGSNETKTYLVKNVSFTATSAYDDFGVIENTYDYYRLDYKCERYKFTKRRRHSTRYGSYYDRVKTKLLCDDSYYAPPITLTITALNRKYNITHQDYYADNIGDDYPLKPLERYSTDIYNHNHFEEDYYANKNSKIHHIYIISGIHKNAPLSFWATIGNRNFEVKETNKNGAKFYFGSSAYTSYDKPKFTRIKLLIFVELLVFFFTILAVFIIKNPKLE